MGMANGANNGWAGMGILGMGIEKSLMLVIKNGPKKRAS